MRLRPIGLALLGSACLLAGPGRSAPRAGGADDSPAAEAAVASGMASEELKRWSIRAAGEPARPAEPRPVELPGKWHGFFGAIWHLCAQPPVSSFLFPVLCRADSLMTLLGRPNLGVACPVGPEEARSPH